MSDKHRVIVGICGGIGNQLFQYACGKSVASANNAELCLDTSWFQKNNQRLFSLGAFQTTASIAESVLLEGILNQGLWSKIFGNNIKVYNEKSYRFDSKILRPLNRRNIYLNGYWQSYKYFDSIIFSLRKELQLIEIDLTARSETVEFIRNSNTVTSIHLRRGDYISNPAVNAIHGTCDIDYYKRAIDRIKKITREKRFVIFSDDIEWTKNNLKIDGDIQYSEGKEINKDLVDLHLMSLCSNNIIANSSFSWWGAWLNHNRGKVVIAPKRWYADSIRNKQTEDLVPEEWCRL